MVNFCGPADTWLGTRESNDMADITGDQRVQSEVLEGLATAVNHRRWFVELALPYLGDDPLEIGSGLGDYALEWAPHFPRFTATEADPDRLVLVQERMAGARERVGEGKRGDSGGRPSIE